MGSNRDVPLKEAKKRKGHNFKEDNCCKFYLLGFCPLNDELFRNTKRHLGECEKVHSENLKEEFDNSPEKADFEPKYVKDLVRYLESIVRTADEQVNRQARNIKTANQDLEKNGINEVAKREIEKIRENCSALLNEAEELAESGDIEGSKQKQAIYDQTKAKADDYEAKSKEPIKEEVCDVCGLRPEDGDGMRKFSHTEGKIHVGFVKVRAWLKVLRDKQEEWDKERQERRAKRDTDKEPPKEVHEKDKEDPDPERAAKDKAKAEEREKRIADGIKAVAEDTKEGGGRRGGGERGGGGDRERRGGERDDRRGGDRDDRRRGDREGERGGRNERGGGREDRERGGRSDRGGGGGGGGDRGYGAGRQRSRSGGRGGRY